MFGNGFKNTIHRNRAILPIRNALILAAEQIEMAGNMIGHIFGRHFKASCRGINEVMVSEMLGISPPSPILPSRLVDDHYPSNTDSVLVPAKGFDGK